MTPDPDPCKICHKIPANISRNDKAIARAQKKLTPIPGGGVYYRGESCQLTRFQLFRCPSCDTHYEYVHYFYSDPESTMGLGRDEDDWYVLSRLDSETMATRLRQLG